MNIFNSYHNTKKEMDNLKNRLNLISKYEEQFNEEKKQLKELIFLQEKLLSEIKNDLNLLSGIENKLYTEIVINGMNVTKAIDKVAFEEEKDVSTLWKNYYPKVKEKIEKLYLITSNDEQENISYLQGGDNSERNRIN